MTPEELREINLESAYILCIYNNGFEISNYRGWNRNGHSWDYGCPKVLMVRRITIPVRMCGEIYELNVEWDDYDISFQTAMAEAMCDFRAKNIVQQYIASDPDISLEQMEHAVSDGLAVYKSLDKLSNDIRTARDTIYREERRKKEEKSREKRLASMTPEKRRRTILEERVFDELAKTPIFRAKLQKSIQYPYDEDYDKEFQDWVVEEVKIRADRIERERPENPAERTIL